MNANVITGILITSILGILGFLFYVSNRQATALGAAAVAAANVSAGDKANEEISADSNPADVVTSLQNGDV